MLTKEQSERKMEEYVFETGKEAVEFAIESGEKFDYVGSSWATGNPGNFGVILFVDKKMLDL